MCCGCNKRFKQHRLIRLQISPKTQALTPVVRKEPGRSAWICCNASCILKIAKHPKRLYRSLRTHPNVSNLISTLYVWILNKVQLQVQQMYTDGVITVETSHTCKRESDNFHVFPSDLYRVMRIDTLGLNFNLRSDEQPLLIRTHHLLPSTIHYSDVLMELKLDSIT